jgi:O-acetyl-ADP-ribose deacetylase (regulator of RNase III)/protein-tyrosine phosphatase
MRGHDIAQPLVDGLVATTGARTSTVSELRVNELDLRGTSLEGRGRAGITFLPGKKRDGYSGAHWRDLDLDLARLRSLGVDALFLLVEDSELDDCLVSELPAVMASDGPELIRFPIRDPRTPTDEVAYRAAVVDLLDRIRRGKFIAIACRGGIDRSGMTASCLLRDAGLTSDQAIGRVQATRASSITIREQQDYVRAWPTSREVAGAPVDSSHAQPSGRGTGTPAEWEVAPGHTLAVLQGDITRIPADAIVNAANGQLGGGSGVNGAILRAGGPAIMADLERRYGPIGSRSCPTGSAVLSAAGSLPARWVIHAVGPVWYGGNAGEPDQLASAYATSLRLADDVGAGHVTFPAISTGIYGYPADLAAAVAVGTLAAALRTATSVERVTLVAYSAATLELLQTALRLARDRG